MTYFYLRITKKLYSIRFQVIQVFYKNIHFIDTVNSFLMGLNGTIFAYGQTGAGKTYSIIGGDFINEL